MPRRRRPRWSPKTRASAATIPASSGKRIGLAPPEDSLYSLSKSPGGAIMWASASSKLLSRLFRWVSPDQAEPLSVWEVLGEEYWRGADPPRDPEDCGDSQYAGALKQYREKRKLWQDAGKPEEGPVQAEYQAAESAFRKIVMARLHAGKKTALCFSGGGIRSTTFGLGVLQGLAAHSWSPKDPATPPRLLAGVDYLSTVSGGGYLGGWFSAWG